MIRLAAAVAALATLAPPQFRASVDAVRIEALVLDRGRPVLDLKAADFAVTDDGAPQTVTVRPIAGQAIDVVIALDISASLQGERMEQLRAGARALTAQLMPDDRATLVAFNDAIQLGPRDTPARRLDARLRTVRAAGGTALVDAIATALVWGSGRDRPRLILVFSDGFDTVSWTRPEQALALARASDGVVDVIVTGELLPTSTARLGWLNRLDDPEPETRFLTELATITGGRVRDGEAGEGLAGAFAQALAQFRTRYEISYTPANPDPGWHAIEVRVPGRRGATVHARRGYQR
jgi:VWFA-related protein